MSETKDTADKTTGGRKPLSLQRTVESGHVRQSFSHGRSKSVVVEKRKTRKLAAPGAPAADAPAPAAPTTVHVETKAAPRPARPEARADAGKSDMLRPEERDARARALAEARKQAVEDAQRAEQQRAAEAAQAALAPSAPSPAA
ncbi:MAG: IF-2-associated domain-containing protein, partial [Rhizobiales bacterium]|nr:IF-2-associated domain-containing protein [Hyphomicrobiales bacterium]